LSRERRHRFQIYREILAAIELEVVNDGNVRPTRVQHLSNLSYDKLKRHLVELDRTGLINMKDGTMKITDRGREFLRNYDRLTDAMHTVGLDY
jgi:predicted transcriptional regulator